MSTGGNNGNISQDPISLRGKVLRLNDDGSVPGDNPFVDQDGYRPEIYTVGHRNTLGLIVHPETGELWNHENGPNGGDEVNILLPGRNYGWPIISFGREYSGTQILQASDARRDGVPACRLAACHRRGRNGRLHR